MSDDQETPEPIDYDAARARVEDFAKWTNTTPPSTILEPDEDGDNCFTNEFLAYAYEQEMSLDWAVLGDVSPLALANRRSHNATGYHAVSERVALMAAISGVEPVRLEVAPEHKSIACIAAQVLLTDDFLTFARNAGADLDWLISGDPSRLIERTRHEIRQELDSRGPGEKHPGHAGGGPRGTLRSAAKRRAA